MTLISLFYEEPDPDRWLPGDRYPRRLLRRVARGPRRPGGQERVFLNLCAGLDHLGVPYTVNCYHQARREPALPVGIIGKSHVLDRQPWRNPILFGASVMSHPLADPGLLTRLPTLRRILVPGEWMRRMCEPHWGGLVHSWPVGIDTATWTPAPAAEHDLDVLLYDKVRWEHDRYERDLIGPVRTHLAARGLRVAELRYGFYHEENFAALLRRCRAMIFLCEHETQGLAYQQALACGIPILAWDRGGCWQDPEYFPNRVRFSPVSSVPYWDASCGETFADSAIFPVAFDAFWTNLATGRYHPRDYILANLTLERCAQAYLEHWEAAFGPTTA